MNTGDSNSIEIIPFGVVMVDRFEEGKKYGLLEMIAGFWRLTKKCREKVDEYSYIKYLQGKLEKPVKKGKDSQVQELLSL
jgi:hypothetical protein